MEPSEKPRQKGVIFGAGIRGQALYRKINTEFDVIAYADNNQAIWGQTVNGVPVISPAQLKPLTEDSKAYILICNELHSREIARQLDEMGLRCYMEDWMLYALEAGVSYPEQLRRPEAYRKNSADDFTVLFVQGKPCSRTNKIASVLKDRGVKTYAAYTHSPSDAGELSYLHEYPFWAYSELLAFVNESEFDIVHCSNTPDILINLLVHSNKKVIHDCHDVGSLQEYGLNSAEFLLEYLANTQANGFLYTTEVMRDYIVRKYGTDLQKTLVVGNFPLRSFSDAVKHPKLSERDGDIHCVYEGHLRSDPKILHRYFEPLWLKLADQKIHVHIYSHSEPEYCSSLERKSPYLHYEGNYNGAELIGEMTRYDIGLAMVNRGKLGSYLDIASLNKVTEYLSAGLPVVSNVPAFVDMLEKLHCGGNLDMGGDLAGQLLRYKTIQIAGDFTQTHGLTMDAHADRILDFYKKVIDL